MVKSMGKKKEWVNKIEREGGEKEVEDMKEKRLRKKERETKNRAR